MGRRQSPYIDATERTLTDAGLANSSARPLPPKSVILSSRAPIGHLVINTVPMSFNQGCKGLIPKNGLHYKFLYYFLIANVDLLNELGTGTTFKELSGGKLKDVSLPMPSLAEQKRIVAILDEALEGIDQATANAERNLANARELYANRVDYFFLSPPSDWKVQTLGDVCHTFDYGTARKSSPRGEMPVLRMGNIQNGEIDWTDLVYTDDVDDKKKYALSAGDVLFNRTNSAEHVGKTAIFRGEREAIFAGYLIRVGYDRSRVDGEFINFYLNSHAARSYGKSVMAQSVNQANISGGKLKEFLFPHPNLLVQKSIAVELLALKSACGNLSLLYVKKISALNNLRNAVLRKAFSGQLTGKESIAA